MEARRCLTLDPRWRPTVRFPSDFEGNPRPTRRACWMSVSFPAAPEESIPSGLRRSVGRDKCLKTHGGTTKPALGIGWYSSASAVSKQLDTGQSLETRRVSGHHGTAGGNCRRRDDQIVRATRPA